MAVYDAQPGRRSTSGADLSAAQRDADEADLDAGLAGVAGVVADARDMTALLTEVAEFAARAIPGVDGAGIALKQLPDGAPRIEAWAATAEFVNEIDRVQYEELHEGPCLTAMQSRRPTVSGSLGSDSRWPHFGGRVARMAVHSALSLPLLVDDTVVGAINAYARARDAFGEHAVQLGNQFAGPAAVSVYNGQLLTHARERTQQLQRALGSRAVIDQAIGIIRSRSGASAEEAFDRLTRLSQSQNVKLHVVAERLLAEAVRRARARHQP
ncbi:GAF and ANTAR domain-containing protein [Mycobacterium sp. 852014-52144_SCH5372336]|uniref:GAF and ANTAR domain-containing protein n=1 Tax=Mycobacterium sp. 852014-52144_SCH5372336 TaxID=1834115 RepID=UPI0007FFA048|nr:GAF and ANTAR domain-containing protein [Mycobacterium sp. 852014-52144_SCH5372336]OBB77155.1 histidine kinase [Mycobacterium sp. 852014-52144_SCH5372336]